MKLGSSTPGPPSLSRPPGYFFRGATGRDRRRREDTGPTDGRVTEDGPHRTGRTDNAAPEDLEQW